jgi:subfamily B ATP-binding cassette protein MsbA
LKEIFKLRPTISSGQLPLDRFESIEFKNVSLRYGDKEVLKNLNLKIERGEKVGVVGDSGGGKSSFIYLLLRLYHPTSGTILLNGRPIEEYSIKSIRERFAYVPQVVHIFNDTIAANVAYGYEIDEEKVKKALQQAELWEFVEQLPKGIWTLLQEGGSNLSGGQRQRIAIARALYRDPDLLILDEATSALDNRSEQKIVERINSLPIGVVTVAHRLSTIEKAKRVYFFKEGRVVCVGPLSHLLRNCPQFQPFTQNLTS